MATYGISVTRDAAGHFTFTAMRNPTTLTITGGTDLNTTTAAQGFQQAATNDADGLKHRLQSPMDALMRVAALVADDRAYNGD